MLGSEPRDIVIHVGPLQVGTRVIRHDAFHFLVGRPYFRNGISSDIEAMIQEVIGVKVLSRHHDISTITGEEIVLFTLAESPDYRQPNE
jgi:hypothetical protein